MKAAVVERYGPPEVVRVVEMPKPVPADDEVLIRVRATTVNSGDARIRALRVPRGFGPLVRLALGFSGPKQKISGFDAAGEVEAVGSKVTRFAPGERVLASRGFKFGCHAEYVTVAESATIAKLPQDLGFADAVSLPFGASTSLAFFRDGGLKAGESILINGASGAVGTMAIQIAKHIGAEVTAVCSSRNADLVASLGADHVIDYGAGDFTRSGGTYDVVMDNHGNAPYARIKHMLKPGGRFLMVVGDLLQTLGALRIKAVVGSPKESEAVNQQQYQKIVDLAARGIIRPVIDSTFPLVRIVDAHRRVDGGHKAGGVVILV